jgi:hypothetical protein
MRRFYSAARFVCALAALISSRAWCQANVDEGLETATIYVDTNTGNDSNPGTKQLPLKTIGAATTVATNNNHSNIGTKVIINPGTYRESVTLSYSSKDTTLPITFQAATTGAAIMSGADIWTGWTVYSGNSSIYTHSWTNKWGLCALDTGSGSSPAEEDIVRRREMVIVNGSVLMQVMSLSAVKVPGTFYVDETKSLIYMWPPTGTNISTATVEIPTRGALFTIGNKSNIVLRGMTFQYANSCRNYPAVDLEYTDTNILLDTDYFYWNNSVGVKLGWSTNTTVQNSVANHNGTDGMKGYETKYDLWSGNQTRYNGWRGAQGVYYSWGVGGTHFGLAHDQTISGLDTSFNQTFGIHWDTDNENIVADGIVSSENLLGASFIEKTQGPVTLTNGSWCNGAPSAGPNNLGFELRNSAEVSISGTTILDNAVNLLVTGVAGGYTIKNWETGQSLNVNNKNFTFSNNIVQGTTSQQLFSDGALNGSDWTSFKNTLGSDYNTWWNTDTSPFTVPIPNLWTKDNYSGFIGATGQDAHSTYKSSSNVGSACNLKVDFPDYWFIMDAFSGYESVKAGSSFAWTPIVVSLGGWTGTVSLSTDGVQSISGATATFSPGSITSSGSSTLTVSTKSTTPKGSYPITIIANNGSTTRTMTVTLTVN